jgi:hypothetical protein
MQHCEGSSAAVSHVHLALLTAAGAAVSAQYSLQVSMLLSLQLITTAIVVRVSL